MDLLVASGRYKLTKKLGSKVFHGQSKKSVIEQVAIKLEKQLEKKPLLQYEYCMYKHIEITAPSHISTQNSSGNLTGGANFIPKALSFLQEGDFNVMIMEQLGPNLEALFQFCEKKFSEAKLCLQGTQQSRYYTNEHRNEPIPRIMQQHISPRPKGGVGVDMPAFAALQSRVRERPDRAASASHSQPIISSGGGDGLPLHPGEGQFPQISGVNPLLERRDKDQPEKIEFQIRVQADKDDVVMESGKYISSADINSEKTQQVQSHHSLFREQTKIDNVIINFTFFVDACNVINLRHGKERHVLKDH